MRHLHAVARDRDDAGVERVVQCGLVRDLGQLVDRHAGADRNGAQHVARRLAHLLDPVGEELVHQLRHRERLSDRGRTALAQHASQLEHEQRVAACRLEHLAQHPAGERQLEPLGQHAARGAEAQWAELRPT